VKPTVRIVVAIAFVIAVAGCSSAGTSQAPSAAPGGSTAASQAVTGYMATIQQHGELRVAGPVYVPFVIRKPDGSYQGIDVDVLGQVASKLGVKMTIIPAGWDTVVAGLQTDKWDVVPALCDTPTREQVIDFITSTVQEKSQYYFLKDNPKMASVKTLDDLNNPNIIIASTVGSAGDELVKKIAPKAQVKEYTAISDPEFLQLVLTGRVDTAGTDWPVTSAAITNQYPDKFTFIPADLASEPTTCPVAWGIPKGHPEFQKYLNDFLAQLISSGQWDTIKGKWFGPDYLKLTQ
jgi:polar amino acid transport system substrate-binding protein